jgi:hypothetical protein
MDVKIEILKIFPEISKNAEKLNFNKILKFSTIKNSLKIR